MGFDSRCVTSHGWCYPYQNYNGNTNKYYHNIDDDVEKIFPDWFYLPHCDECKEYREFTKNVCPYQPMHKISLLCDNCGIVYIDYYYSYKHNPTCSHDGYV